MKIFSLFAFVMLFQLSAFVQETLSGTFELNKTLNQYANSDEHGKQQFRQMLQTTNIRLIEQYISSANEFNFTKADSLIQTDEKLSRMPQRMVILLYDYYAIEQAGLLDYYCLVQEKASAEETKVVFVTAKQLKKLQPKLGENMELKVKYVSEAPLVKLKLYKLAGD